jgi:hypothetical protein
VDAVTLCRGFTVEQWRMLRKRLDVAGALTQDETAWNCAIDIFARRVRERFLSCIEALQRADSRSDKAVAHGAPADCSTLPNDGDTAIVVPGFAIMALCCLLVETLQSFREQPGQAAALGGDMGKFKRFLKRPSFGLAFQEDEVAEGFYKGVRNGILHDAETRHCVIWRDEPEDKIIEKHGDQYALNRELFYGALKAEFESYLREIRSPHSAELRCRFVDKMDELVNKS